FRTPNSLRLPHQKPVLRGRLLDWRLRKLVAASLRPIRLRIDGGKLVPRRDQRLQRWHGELRRAEKDNPHSGYRSLFPVSCLLQLTDLAPDHIPLQRAQVTDEQNAVQMINFVLV